MQKNLFLNNLWRITLFIITIGFIGCSSQAVNTSLTQTNKSNQNAKFNKNLPQVVATTSVICDLTKQIAAETINLICLIPPDVNPHNYQIKSEDRQAINSAKLILYNGYNLEPSLIRLIQKSKNSAVKIAVAERAVSQPKTYFKRGKKITDSHLWHNPQNAIKMVELINKNLVKLAPKNAKIYNKNTRELNDELNQLHSWIKSRIASIPAKKRTLITTHNEMGYYVKTYGLNYTLINNINNLTDDQFNKFVKDIQTSKVPVIFPEKTINPDLMESITTAVEVRISPRELYTDGLGKPGSDAETYQTMMIANTRTIVEGLGGTYLKFEPRNK
jgi:manganese/iron transport system substrate-binding protein